MIEFTINKKNYKVRQMTIADYYRMNHLIVQNSTTSKLEIVSELSGCDPKELSLLEKEQFVVIWDALMDEQLSLYKNSEFKQSFDFEGTTYVFTEMSKLTIGEFADMEILRASAGQNNNIHTMLALMYRPSVKVRGKLVAEPYDSETLNERAETFLNLPITYVYGAINFFLQVPKFLLSNIAAYLMKDEKVTPEEKEILELAGQVASLTLESGTTYSSSLLEKIQPKLAKLQSLALSSSSTSLPTRKTKPEGSKKQSVKQWLTSKIKDTK